MDDLLDHSQLNFSKEKNLLEKDIEDPVCKYATDTHCMRALKFTSPARRSVPDRIFLCDGSFVFFIEFKKPGEPPTPNQTKEHIRLRAQGFDVFVVDNVAGGKAIVDAMAQKAKRRSLGL